MGYERNTSCKAFLILAILHTIYLPTHTIIFITSLVSLFYSYLAFKVLQALHRLIFHPLTNSIIHEQYGPIVRSSPDELHNKHSEYYNTIFNIDPYLDKRVYALDNLQQTPSHSEHKLRRHALSPFFSRATITSLEPSIRDSICSYLQAAKTTPTPINISLLYRSLTTSITTSYCSARNFKFLSSPWPHAKTSPPPPPPPLENARDAALSQRSDQRVVAAGAGGIGAAIADQSPRGDAVWVVGYPGGDGC